MFATAPHRLHHKRVAYAVTEANKFSQQPIGLNSALLTIANMIVAQRGYKLVVVAVGPGRYHAYLRYHKWSNKDIRKFSHVYAQEYALLAGPMKNSQGYVGSHWKTQHELKKKARAER